MSTARVHVDMYLFAEFYAESVVAQEERKMGVLLPSYVACPWNVVYSKGRRLLRGAEEYYMFKLFIAQPF